MGREREEVFKQRQRVRGRKREGEKAIKKEREKVIKQRQRVRGRDSEKVRK